ncbi:hypothetical protein VTK26DRAFT_8569 [Humicola hyalothermophila]
MAWDHLSITDPHLVYIILGGFTSLFMLCSSFIKERMYIGEATVATLCGVIFGPYAANLINPATWGSVDIVTIEFSRLVLVVQCFAVGVELPKYYMDKHWKSVAFLLIPVMSFGWLITALFVWWLIEPLNFLESLVVAACVTATDPVLAASVVGKGKFSKRVPKHLRDLLSAESGCNDGMAFPFVYLSLYLIHDRQSARDVSFHWIVYTILYECVFGAVYGFIIGYLARHGIKYAEKHELIDRESFLVFYFVLALFCAGSGSILGVDDLLVGFAAGVGFSNDGWFTQKTEEAEVSNVIDLLINLTYFVYFGTIIPWRDFNNAELGLQAWRLAVLAIFIILFRRIPIMMALKPVIPDIKTWREALFAGHFGPIGVGAIFVAMLARAELESGEPVPLENLPPKGSEHYEIIATVWPIVSFIVVSSIIVHGSSIAVFTLGKRINTLTITMSYTQANEDGPSWMNRLPRISSQSRSQGRTMSDTEGDELKMPEFPPGTLPPVGLPGNFMRRARQDDTPGRGSRSSSLAARRRKKWDDGIGPGGPISQSAIFPQRRTHTDQSTSEMPTGGSDQPRQDSAPLSPSDVSPSGPPEEAGGVRESEVEGANEKSIKSASPEVSTAPGANPVKVNVYDEGDHIVLETSDGNVLAVEPTQHQGVAEHAHALASKLKSEVEPSGWSYDALKKKVMHWRQDGTAKNKEKQETIRKAEPAQAFQFGNTIIVENRDGEVIKKYDLPGSKHQGDLVSQGLKYMGMGVFAKAVNKSAPTTEALKDGEAGPSSTQKAGNKTTTNDEQEDDDKHIRFTIGGVGRRMTKEDFIQEMQKLNSNTRREVVDRSTAPEPVKAIAKQGPQNADAEKGPVTSAQDDKAKSQPHSASPSPRKAPSSRAPSNEARGTGLEGGNVANEEPAETPAERRRREAALGMGSGTAEDDSDDDDTPRVPPSRRSIRFADVPERRGRE